jgi:succinate dehydrogenase / fumarate reductase cytochrome b subunit
VRVSPDAYDEVIATYKTPLIGFAELGLVAAVLYHGFNGLRVILIDFWSKGSKYQVAMFWVVIAVTVITLAFFAPRHIVNVLSHMTEGH